MDTLLNQAAIVVTTVLQLLILFILIRRKLTRRFFWFFIYLAYEVIESGLRFSVVGNQRLYVLIYWWTEIGEVTLEVLAFRESFLNVFREYQRLRWFASVVWGCIGAALLYALFKALLFPSGAVTRRGSIIIGLEVAINLTLVVASILYFILFSFFKIKEHQWESGIISGFSIYVALATGGFLIRSLFGMKFKLLNEWLSPVGYLLAEATWALELSRPESDPSEPNRDLAVDDLSTMNHYSRVLRRLLRRKP